MKLINYNYGYIDLFSCSIHGKIIMSMREWNKAKKYLLNPAVVLYYSRDKTMLKEDMRRAIRSKQWARINVRVYATEAIVKKFGLKNYKRGNFMLEIKTNALKKW